MNSLYMCTLLSKVHISDILWYSPHIHMKKTPVECPVSKVAELLSDTWTILIIHFLIEHPYGFCDLERALDGISTRTLTLKLNKLIEEKMAKKNKDGIYEATPKGKGLKVVEDAMKRYQKKYL